MAEENNDSQALLNRIVYEYMRDQKRRRRWRWIVRLIVMFFIVLLAYKIFQSTSMKAIERNRPHVGLIDLTGTIFEGQSASADNFARSMKAAYKNSSMKALIIRINSPGGSPVQADYMYSTLQYYRQKYPDIKTYAVCVDLCASAAYYVAAGADEIYANPSSMVGSIGVLFNGFGFVDAMQKLGISRRLQTAGKYKDFLDPFSPQNPEQQKMLQSMLNEVHQQFIYRVRQGRGQRLKENPEIFSGLFWTGVDAKKLGLIDGFASSGQVSRDIIKIEYLVDYSQKTNLFEKLAQSMGTAAAEHLPLALGIKQGILV